MRHGEGAEVRCLRCKLDASLGLPKQAVCLCGNEVCDLLQAPDTVQLIAQQCILCWLEDCKAQVLQFRLQRKHNTRNFIY